MKRPDWLSPAVLAASVALLISCSTERLAVSDPPPSPQPAPASQPTHGAARSESAAGSAASVRQAAVDDDSLPLAELAEREQEAALQSENASLFAYLEEPREPGSEDDPEQPALAAEEGALFDELVAEADEIPIPENASLSERREIRLRNTRSDLPLTLNSQVIGLIKYFTEGRGRSTTRATLGRSGAFREMIERVLEEEDVPPELFYLAQAESGFRSKARSYARATGMWQFMSFRGKQYGLRQDRYLEERYDPEKATRAAARHLKDLYIEFDDWYLAMAAYNAGPGRVSRAIARGKTRDYWELCRRRLLPRQTRNYVPIILAMTYVDKNLDMYDVGTIDYAPARGYDTVRVSEPVSLELLADIIGTRASQLEDLNPALARSATPPYAYDLRVPLGAGEGLLAELAGVPQDKRLQWRRHAVEDGETLAEVAKRWKVDIAALAGANGLSADDPLSAGLALNIPTATKLRSFRSYGGAGGLVDDGTGRYRIANGDTLGGIARRFGVSVAQLRAWNGLPNSFIRAGRYLIVRPNGGSASSSSGSAPRASASAGPAPEGRYRVRSGDTLGKIAQRHRTSVSRLMAWNGLRSTRIRVGQTLKVPGSAPSSASSSGSGPAPAGGGQYRIRSGDNLASIAQRFGVSVGELQQWNGMGRSTRIRAGSYLRVRPASSSSSAAASSPGGAGTYRVRPGDSLTVIARRQGVAVEDLKRWNGLTTSRIRAGQMLKVGGSASSTAAPREAAVRASAPRQPSPQAPASSPPSGDGRYRIRPGDTLGHIAERFGVTASDLRRWNNMRGSRITAGDYLTVRPPGASAAPSPSPARRASNDSGAQRYRIRSGDTLATIADRFGVSVRELMAWNGLRNSRIRAGDYLTIRGGGSSGGE